MKIKKVLFSLIAFIIIFNLDVVLAKNIIEMTECEYTDEYIAWISLSPSERENKKEPIKCKTENNFYNAINSHVGSPIASARDSKFNLNDYGYITPLKDQGTSSTCWAFGTIASIESSMLMEGKSPSSKDDLDLSEAHLEVSTTNEVSLMPMKRNLRNSLGGNPVLASAYLANRLGPIKEEQFPYPWLAEIQNNVKSITNSDMKSNKAILVVNDEVSHYGKTEPCDNDTIFSTKEYLVDHGAMYAGVAYVEGNFTANEGKIYYYNSSSSSINHEVNIVGWDDTIPASYFKSNSGKVPTRNGGWIIKNSNYKEDFQYVSYDDITICSLMGGYYNIEYEIEDNIYIHDKAGITNFIELREDFEPTYANKYTKISSKVEKLEKVVIYTAIAGQKFDIVFSENGDLTSFKNVYTGVSNKIGFTTIKLDNINIYNGTFAIGVKYYPLDKKNIIAYYGYDSNSMWHSLSVPEPLTFFSEDGVIWNELKTDVNGNLIMPIRAYTNNVEQVLNKYNVNYFVDKGVLNIAKNSDFCETDRVSCEITLPGITAKDGYNVLGWYTSETNGEKVGNPGEKYKLSKNTTLYALTKENVTSPETTKKFSVTFTYDNGITSISNTTISCDVIADSCEITLPDVVTKEGYSLLGFYTSQTGGTKVGNSKDKYIVTNDTILYAQSKKIDVQSESNPDPVGANPENDVSSESLTIIFEKTVGVSQLEKSSISCESGQTSCEIILPKIVAESGYNILGFYSKSVGGEKIGNPGDKYLLSKSITVYARAAKANEQDKSIKNTTEIIINKNPKNSISATDSVVVAPDTASTISIAVLLAGSVLILYGVNIGYKKYKEI